MTEKVRILTYHRVGPPRGGRKFEPLTVPPNRFRRQLRLLEALGATFVSLDLVADWLEGKAGLPPRATVLTFDDGFDDLYRHAFPLLAERSVPAMIYVVPDRQDDGWRRDRSPGPLKLLSWPRIREMADAGLQFGSHSCTHARLTECDDARLHREVTASRKQIEDQLGSAVQHFCYPFGNLDDRVAGAAARAGYRTACTTARGAVSPGADPLRLPRLTVGKRMNLFRFFMRVTIRS